MGGAVPEEMDVYDVPEANWAVFPCVGALPDSVSNLTDQIIKEWVPDHLEYWLLPGFCAFERFNIFQLDKIKDPDYRCEIWMPLVIPDGFIKDEEEE